MSSTASPQISAARSGGIVRMRSAKSSKPYTHCATRSLSYSSSSMMTLQQAMARAPSVPGRTCQHHLAARAQPRDARVHHDALRAALHHVDDRVAEEAVGVRRQRVLAPARHQLGQREVRVVVALGRPRGYVDLRVADGAVDAGRRHVARPVARLSAHGVHVVGRAEHRRGERGAVQRFLASRAAEHHHRLAAVFRLQLFGARHDLVDGLVPRDAVPFVQPAVFPRALHGVDDAVGMVHVFGQGEATHAQASLRDGMLLVAFHFHQLAVHHVQLDAAPHRVATRRRPGARPHPVVVIGPCLIGLFHEGSFLS